MRRMHVASNGEITVHSIIHEHAHHGLALSLDDFRAALKDLRIFLDDQVWGWSPGAREGILFCVSNAAP